MNGLAKYLNDTFKIKHSYRKPANDIMFATNKLYDLLFLAILSSLIYPILFTLYTSYLLHIRFVFIVRFIIVPRPYITRPA